MFQAPKPFRKEVVVDEPSKDDATAVSNFFSCYKKYQHKEPFKHLVIPSMTIEEFWKDGDKDYNKFEYGKQLVQAATKSKLQLMDKELMTIHHGFVISSCVNIYRLVVCSILLMVRWPSFLCYVITYTKDE
jgi:hypothetical protein